MTTDERAPMTPQERRAWMSGIVWTIGSAVCLAALALRSPTDVRWGGLAFAVMLIPLIDAAGRWALRSWFVEPAPDDDERDRQIRRSSDYTGFLTIGVAAALALLITLLAGSVFWTATVLVMGFAAAAIVSNIVTIVGYRRGLPDWAVR